MFRATFLTGLLASTVLIGSALAVADPPELKPGEKFEGELTAKKEFVWSNTAAMAHYANELPIRLRAGQSLSVAATVTGKGRKIWIGLQDPAGTMIAGTIGFGAFKTDKLEVEEVNATGKYTIVILSDRIGAYNLEVSGPANDKDEVKRLEEKVKDLRRRLAEAEAKLKAAKEKSGRKLDGEIRKPGTGKRD